MLSIEIILALHHAQMAAVSQLFRTVLQGCHHIIGRHGRIFNGGIFLCGSLKTNGARGNDQISAQDLRLHSA